MKTKNEKSKPATNKQANHRRPKDKRTTELSTTLRKSVANKLMKSAPDLDIISSRLAKLEQQLLEVLPLPQTDQDLLSRKSICRAILAVVEEHLQTFTFEFPHLYRDFSRVSSSRAGLEGYLGKAAKRQESDIKKCHKLLDEFENLIQGSARPLIERYRTKSSATIAHQRMCALRHLRSIVPEKYSAANGRPIEQVKHVLAGQLKHVFLKHNLPIKQNGRIRDSLAFRISKAVRDALKFRSFDINESFKATRRRTTPR